MCPVLPIPCVMSLYDGLSVETAPLQGSLAELTSQPSPPDTKDEEKTSWNTNNFKLMASQLQRQKATRGVGRGRGGLRGRGLSTLSVQVSSIEVWKQLWSCFQTLVLEVWE